MRELPSGTSGIAASDSIEIAEVVRTIRRGWRVVLGCTTFGVVAAVAVLLFAPRIYQGKASVLVRASTDAGSSLLSRIGGVGDLLGSGAASLGIGKAAIETEIQVLNSQVLAGRVIDSLQLQARVMDPSDMPASALLMSSSFPNAFAPRRFRFEKTAGGRYRVTGNGFTGELTQGVSGTIPVGNVTLAMGELPASFELKLYDREDATDRLQKWLDVGKAGGDVAKITYKGDDGATAQAVPNALVAMYMERRRTVDRGTNQKRVEYLTEQVATTGAELGVAERALRRQQESSGVLDPQVFGRVGLEQAAELRKSLIEVQVEEGAITQLLAQANAGGLSLRSLAAYPAFLRGASLNALIGQLSELESKRSTLLERRTDQDPEVMALSQSVKSIEAQFVPMATTYAAALTRQRMDLTKQLDSMQTAMLSVPAAAETGGHLQRDVIRLSQIYAALQAQLVAARLAAIDEGGDVRQLDVAIVPRKPWFPRPWLTLGGGVAVGLFAGLIAALALSWFGRWVRGPVEIERATGIPAQRLQVGAPLLLGAGSALSRTLLVIPIEDRARAAGGVVAQRLLRTATSRSVDATILDLSADALRPGLNGRGNGAEPASAGGVSAAIEDLEKRYGMVVVQLPGLSSDATAAALREGRPVLLVAPADRVDRARLLVAVETLRRLNIPCAGIVVGGGDSALPVG
jgi:uncharacterized protein involved in exopolysaccharide biosynthesis